MPLTFSPNVPPEIQKRVRSVYSFFSEIHDRDITCKWSTEMKWASACWNRSNFMVLTPDGCNQVTIAHELTHACQQYLGYPHGEDSCDIYMLARCDQYLDGLPHYIHRAMMKRQINPFTKEVLGDMRTLHILANMAIEQRNSGNRQYIKWFKGVLIEMAQGDGGEWGVIARANTKLLRMNCIFIWGRLNAPPTYDHGEPLPRKGACEA